MESPSYSIHNTAEWKKNKRWANKAFFGGGGGGDVSFGFCTQRGSYIFQEQ